MKKSTDFPVSQLLTIDGRKDSEFMRRTVTSTTATASSDHQRPSRTPWKPHRDTGHLHKDCANMIISSRK